MRRRLFIFGFAMSLLLCFATAEAWVRDYSFRTSFDVRSRHSLGSEIFLECFHGKLCVVHRDMIRCAPGLFAPSHYPNLITNVPKPMSGGSFAGIRISLETMPYDRDFTIEAPPWAIIAITSVLGLFFWRRGRADQQAQALLCVSCGYDLRATPDRCPECGMIVASAKLVA
jgi:hypothetical protein